MKRILPILLVSTFAIVALFTPLSVVAGPNPPAPQIQPNPAAQPAPGAAAPAQSIWVIDPEVTFIGKNAARSGLFLDWTLQNYHWSCVKQIGTRGAAAGGVNGQTQAIYCDNTNNPIASYWSLIVLYIVVPLLFIVILATSIVIIITRGKSLTIMRFIPRFVAVVLLIVFSYSLLQFFYQFTDLIQGFFLRTDINKPCPPDCIQQTNLLYVGWSYKDFIGLRLLGDQYAESAFISLLLTKLTALTYFVMVFLLLVRKIILWFFIIVSPIFPILLLYYPVRNTAKIWIGEFFRWLLYAPLFAIFLSGLVYLWKNNIPLVFTNPSIGVRGQEIFPTAVNILLGGPNQFVKPENSINLIETFALYVVSLIMLWIVILLPWILLQIFLDYASNFAPGDTAVMKTLVNLASTNKIPPAGGGGSAPPSTGVAISLPFSKKFSIPKDLQPTPTGSAKELVFNKANVNAIMTQSTPFSAASVNQVSVGNANINSVTVNTEVAALANVKVPTMRDIAKYDTALMSRDSSKQQEVSRITQTLERIANPVAVTNTVEREQVTLIKEKISESSEKGNLVATSIISAANNVSRDRIQASTSELKSVLSQIANPASASSATSSTAVVSREKLAKLNQTLQSQSSQNNSQIAKSLLSVSEKSSTADVEKIRDQIKVAASRGDRMASSIISTVNTASQKTQSAIQTKSVLKQIANPASVTNPVEKEKFTKLHDALQRESKENSSSLASSILQVSDSTSVTELDKIREQLSQTKNNTVVESINTVMPQNQSPIQTKTVLKQIANPASVTNPVERAKFAKVHDSLQKESKENNNQLASSILKVSDSTSVTELDKIREQLSHTKDSSVLQSVNSIVQQNQSSTHVKSVLQEVANPSSARTINKEKVNKLHESLSKASKSGNQLATSILSVSDKTSIEDIQKLQEKIQEAQAKGEPVATELAAMSQNTASLPTTNRVQNVSREDYQAVRDMWKQNYQNLEVPQGMAGTRADWIKDDVESIDETIGLLTSPDQDKVKEGMEQVSNLLPFLMVGGFSQDEIVQYLQAKQDAAKEISKTLVADEEDQISVNTTTTHAAKTMSATIEESNASTSSTNVTSSSLSSSSDAGDDASPLANINITNVSNVRATIQPQVSSEILAMVNLKLPKLRDIAQYETRALKKDMTRTADVEKMQNVLGKIADPSKITDSTERSQFEKVRQTLLDEKQKGNLTAEVLLNASLKAQGTSSNHVKSVLSQIANPSLATVEADKKRFTELHESLTKASAEGNELAKSILATHDKTSVEDIQKLSEKLKDAKIKGEPVAQSILEHLPEAIAPDANRLQPVSDEDYEEVKKMWEENYRTLPIPTEFGTEATGRISWIESDVKLVEETIALLTSSDAIKQQEGMQKVSEILPMLTLGGFSSQEVISYLNAKIEAGNTVIAELQKEEEGKETISVSTESKPDENVLQVEEEKNTN